ncbi:MAG TPA: MBL fold metallo-hydrolase [Ktedonobacterales bacterium]|jgi:ribonuclease BN (tRNA processing enzyme)
MAELIFLGTGAALPSVERANTALAISLDGTDWLQIDAGGDIYRSLARAKIPPDGVKDLVITHAHIDHIGALPSLIESFRLSGRHTPLRIWALSEVQEVIQRLLSLYRYELTLDRWPFALDLRTIDSGSTPTLAGISTRFGRMDHALPSVGVRLDLPRGPVCYTCDTQPTPALPALARDVDLLITECTFAHRDVADARISKHMTALEAGQQAAEAGARALALVHLGFGPRFSEAEARAEAGISFKGSLLIPYDGQVIDV